MSILQQYKESLKIVEAEEILDLLIYRPLAFIFVKITYGLDFLTPNFVSSMAMIVGVTAGIMFGLGTYQYLVYGAILYFLCNILDCADGQIARLKKNGTKVGRIVDGFIDYIVSTAVFLGAGIGLTAGVNNHFVSLWGNIFNLSPVVYVWIITILAAFSSAFQAFYFDLYRNKFLEIVHNKFSPLEDEIKEYQQELERVDREPDKAGFLDSFLISIYLRYTRMQMKMHLAKAKEKPSFMPNTKAYYIQNKLLLRMWSYIGSTTHITICVICALLNNMELFLLICILPLNLLFAGLYLAQSKVSIKLNKD